MSNTNFEVKTVGVREFRKDLSKHLMSDNAIAVTKQGLTVGYYIPTHRPISDSDKQSLTELSKQLTILLEDKGIDSEQLIEDVKELRRQSKNTSDD